MSGSLTRTISRNIYSQGSAVVTTISIMRASHSGSSGFGTRRQRAGDDEHSAGSNGLGGAGQGETRISSNLRIGVRHPSCRPRALSSIKR